MIEVKEFGQVTQMIMGRLMGGKPVYTTACYLVDGLLLDSGPVHTASELEEVLRSCPVHTLVNTHHHEDHIGGNRLLQEKLGLGSALAHPLAIERIRRPEIWISRLRAYQYLAWGDPPASEAREISPEIRSDHYCFRVVHTPGHSDDHICLVEEEQGWLFSGDIFIAEKVRSLRSDEDANGIIDSLHELLKYDFDTLYCSSGRVETGAKEKIRNKIVFWEDLRQKVRELWRQGAGEEEIRERLLGPETALLEPTEGDFGKINLVRSFLKQEDGPGA